MRSCRPRSADVQGPIATGWRHGGGTIRILGSDSKCVHVGGVYWCLLTSTYSPVVIHSNPAMTLDSPVNADERNQTRRAARITHAALQYAEKIQRSAIPREYTKDSPMCMAQYTRIFSHCRVPALPSDKLIGFAPAESRHIVVAHKSQFYAVAVYHPTEGRLLTSGELEGQLNHIVSDVQLSGARQVRLSLMIAVTVITAMLMMHAHAACCWHLHQRAPRHVGGDIRQAPDCVLHSSAWCALFLCTASRMHRMQSRWMRYSAGCLCCVWTRAILIRDPSI